MRRWWAVFWATGAFAAGLIGAGAIENADSLGEAINQPAPAYQGPFPYHEEEPVVTASPPAAVAFELPAGSIVRDYEVSPIGNEVGLIVEDRTRRQRVAFWRFATGGFARTIEVPAPTTLASLTWRPDGKSVFLLTTAPSGSRILKLDVASATFAPTTVLSTDRTLRRLVVGPRPFEGSTEKAWSLRLFFGEKLANGNYALRTVREDGKTLYTLVGPERDAAYRERASVDGAAPNTTIAPFGLPVAFHPAGNVLIWEDERKCLHKISQGGGNWGKDEPFGHACGHAITYVPNGLATIDWQPGRPGIVIHGLVDRTDRPALGEYAFESLPSHMPDGKGVVAVTVESGKKFLRYLPIDLPLANVVNAWMYAENAADQQKFVRDRGLFRPLPTYEQLYSLYDSESYLCGEPDTSVPTRPYFVTTDLFWELYAAAFNGLFVILEREQAAPALTKFVTLADEDLRAHHAGTPIAKAFAAARAVLEGRRESDPEARLILAAQSRVKSPALDVMIDYAQFRPRGHYRTEEQKRYFAAARYLGELPLKENDTTLLRSLDPAVGRAALAWIDVYRPFIAASRFDLVWKGDHEPTAIASHAAGGARIFPLSWGLDNEALDNVVDHMERPPAERITGRDGTPRLLPSGLDLAAIAGNALAHDWLERSGVLAQFPNLAPRIEILRQRFAATQSPRGNLYVDWIAALATQWGAPDRTAAIAGPLWDAKRLQTGLASWTTLRHATVLVNEKVAAECGEGGFESIILRPPRGYVEPDPATFAAIAALFDATIETVRKAPAIARDGKMDAQLRGGIIRRLTESRDNVRKYQQIAEKELRQQPLSAQDYELIQYVGRAAEHNFLIFMSLSNANYALSNPDPMMKVVDVANSPTGELEAAVGRPLEWDQIVPYFGRAEIVKGAVYAYHEFQADKPLDDAQWRDIVDRQIRPGWVTPFVSAAVLSCPARQP